MLILGQCSPSLPCLGCNLIGTVSCYFLLSLSAHSRSELFYTATFPPALQPRLFLSFITTSPSRTFSVSSSPGSNAFLHPSLYHRPPTFSLKFSGHSWVGSEREVLAVFFSLLLACSLKAPPPPLLCLGQRLQLKLCKPGHR